MPWSSSGKCCLNCAFWQGNRSQAYRGARWECNHPSDKGKCAQNEYPTYSQGPNADQGTGCKKFIELPKR